MQTIIFDIGGVLIDWNPRYLYRKLFSSSQEMEYFLSEICSPEWNAALDAGRPFEEACAEKISRYPQYASQIEAYRTRWMEMIRGPVEGTPVILEELKRNHYPLYALSNFSAETFPRVQERFSFFKLFNGIVLSGEEKINKPDPEIYRRLLNRYHLSTPDCLFIDDTPANIIAAEELGFQTVSFSSSTALRQTLKEYKILF